MAVPEATTLLAGFVLAHAAWSVSDLSEGQLLVPLAMIEEGSERKLLRFEAETQEVAISKGKEFVQEQKAAASTWAFAREGQINTATGYVDILVVEAWSDGMAEPITYIQPFQPFASGTFKLLGPAVPVVGGSMLSPEASEPYLAVLYRGISSHGKAASLWASWQ
jgi:hypothetical protein